MKKKALPLILAAVLFLCTLGGCILDTGSEEREIAVSSFPENLDPALYTTEEEAEVIARIFKRLVTLGDEGEILPSAAETFAVREDGLEYTFMLDASLCWSDGERVRAEDYAFALQRILLPDTGSPYAEWLSAVKEIRVQDEDTLILTLSKPDNRLLYFLSGPAASPCREDFFRSTHGRYGLSIDTILGNGDWRLTTWEDGKLRVRGKSGTAHEGESVCFLKETEENGRLVQTAGAVYGLRLNESGTFSSESLRQALLYDLPRELADFPEGFSIGSDASLLYPSYDQEEAYALYRKGVSESKPSEKLTLLIPEESEAPGLYDRLCTLSQIWQRDLGLYFSIERTSLREIRRLVKAGEYDAALMELDTGWGEPYGELENFLENADTDFLSLYTQAVSASEEESGELYAACERKIFEKGLFIPLFCTEALKGE